MIKSYKDLKKDIRLYNLREKILNHLKIDNVGLIDQEDVLYFKENFPFKERDFYKFCRDLQDYGSGLGRCCTLEKIKNHKFILYEERFFFSYNKEKFILRYMNGQGSCMQLIDPKKEFSKTSKIKYLKDNEIKLESLINL